MAVYTPGIQEPMIAILSYREPRIRRGYRPLICRNRTKRTGSVPERIEGKEKNYLQFSQNIVYLIIKVLSTCILSKGAKFSGYLYRTEN